MSTYYGGCIITAKKRIAKDIDMNCIKCFNFEDVEEVYDENILKDAYDYTTSTAREYLGQVLKEKLAGYEKLDQWIAAANRYEEGRAKGETPVVLSASTDEKEIKEIYSLLERDVDVNEYAKKGADERKAYNEARYSVFVEMPYTYKGGSLVNAECLKKTLESYTKSLEKAKAKKAKWEELQTSLEYLKLSGEEKENVQESFSYVEEDIEYNKDAIDSINQLIGALELFSSYDETAYMYVFNYDCGRTEWPEWLEKLVGRKY